MISLFWIADLRTAEPSRGASATVAGDRRMPSSVTQGTELDHALRQRDPNNTQVQEFLNTLTAIASRTA